MQGIYNRPASFLVRKLIFKLPFIFLIIDNKSDPFYNTKYKKLKIATNYSNQFIRNANAVY